MSLIVKKMYLKVLLIPKTQYTKELKPYSLLATYINSSKI